MTKFGVWFAGDENEPASLCYYARKPYTADAESEAALYRIELSEAVNRDISMYKIVKLEIEE